MGLDRRIKALDEQLPAPKPDNEPDHAALATAVAGWCSDVINQDRLRLTPDELAGLKAVRDTCANSASYGMGCLTTLRRDFLVYIARRVDERTPPHPPEWWSAKAWLLGGMPKPHSIWDEIAAAKAAKGDAPIAG